MLEKLTNSGMPIYRNCENGKLAIEAPYVLDGYGDKPIAKMDSLFKDTSKNDLEENVYDVYRDICSVNNDMLLKQNKFQYDITVIHDGLVGSERKKTSGHFHGWNASGKHSYPEVYEVLSGTAIFVLQKSMNFDAADPSKVQVDDILLVKVKSGQSIIVPPDYGHCSVNAGEGDLIFSNLAYKPCPVIYDAIRYHHGMSVYVEEQDGRLAYQKNMKYSNLPKIRFAKPKENGNLGIGFNHPIYKEFLKAPEKFDFLGHPDKYVDTIMNMFCITEELA
jgi:glucose-6-phosphate isomerase